jgi:hypothetical protein
MFYLTLTIHLKFPIILSSIMDLVMIDLALFDRSNFLRNFDAI